MWVLERAHRLSRALLFGTDEQAAGDDAEDAAKDAVVGEEVGQARGRGLEAEGGDGREALDGRDVVELLAAKDDEEGDRERLQHHADGQVGHLQEHSDDELASPAAGLPVDGDTSTASDADSSHGGQQHPQLRGAAGPPAASEGGGLADEAVDGEALVAEAGLGQHAVRWDSFEFPDVGVHVARWPPSPPPPPPPAPPPLPPPPSGRSSWSAWRPSKPDGQDGRATGEQGWNVESVSR